MSMDQENTIDDYGTLFGLLGVGLMLILSAVGSTVGATLCSSAATMVVGMRPDLLVSAYIPILMSSTCFLYAIVITMFVLYKINLEYTLSDGMCDGLAALTYGVAALFGGIYLGSLNKKSILRLSEDKKFFLSFIFLNATMEVPILFAMLCALVAVNGK
jgi:F0F1-type ATP synthase membrane subunit c/vacuolar-type H+-ATPase subunit K